MSRALRRRGGLVGPLLLAALWAGCDGAGPAGVDGEPGVALHLVARAESPARLPSALRPSTLLVEVRTTGGALVRDTTVQVEAGQELELAVPVTTVSESQEFLVQLFLRSGTQVEVYRSERTPVLATDPEVPGDPTEVLLLYSGPGAGADHLAIVPAVSSVLLGQTTTLEARAFSATGDDQGVVPVEWTSLNPNVLELTDPEAGVWQARDSRGVARVTASLEPMGFVDTATVYVNPPPGDLRQAGGNNQEGKAGGRLADPVRVRVLGTDGLPLAGAEVAFQPSSGGQVTPAVAVTGSDGRAEAEWTLGPTLGDQTLGASVVTDPSLTTSFTADATAAALASLSVTPTQVTLDAVGATQQVEVSGRDIFDNEVTPTGVSWSSSDADVATVSSGGRITAVANGQASIRATAEGVTSPPVQVTVSQVPVAARIQPASGWTLSLGDTLAFEGIALDRLDRTIPGAAFQWSSNNTGVLTINSSGQAVGRGLGQATVTATLSGATSITATATGTVGPAGLHTLVVTPGSVTFDALTATRELSVVGRDRFGNPVELEGVSWTSGDTDVARVSATGVVRAIGNGSTTVTAASEDVVSNPVQIVVDQVPVEIAIDPGPGWEVARGEEIGFTATALDRLDNPLAGATFEWSSSSTGILEIDEDGDARGVTPGPVTVTARLSGASLSGTSAGNVVHGAVVDLIVAPDVVDLDAIEATRQLSVEGRDRFGNVVPVQGVSWSSSQTSVATVSAGGLVTATGNGSADIRASVDGVTSNRAEVRVEQVPVGISISPASGWVIFDRQRLQFTAVVFDRLGNAIPDPHLHWDSSDTDILSIGRHSGDAVGRGPGVVTVTVELADNEAIRASSTGVVRE